MFDLQFTHHVSTNNAVCLQELHIRRTRSSAILSAPERSGSGVTAAMDDTTPTPATEWTAAMHTSSDVLSETAVGGSGESAWKCSAILQLGHCSQNASVLAHAPVWLNIG